jgi:hypothetical protein
MEQRRRNGVVVLAVVVLTVLGLAAPASAEPERHTMFDREDAFAEFVVHHGGCNAARTVVQVSVLHTTFRELPAPAVREVLAGVSISEFDCDGQFVFSAEGGVDPGVPFDVRGALQSSTVDLTVDVCQTVPAPGGCFPVAIDLNFTGVGPVDRDRQDDRVDEPDCKITVSTVTATRTADVQGTISFEGRTLAVSTADLTDTGAYLSSESNHTLQLGDGCIER